MGHVFLGTPHLILENVQERQGQMQKLLKASQDLSKSQVTQALKDLHSFAAISKRYEQALDDAKSQVHVLNVFEKEQTKRGRFSSNKEIVRAPQLSLYFDRY